MYTYPSSFLFLFFIIGLVKANEPTILEEFGCHHGLTDDWARHLLKSMEWLKRKRRTGKVEPSVKFLQKEKFSYQREISRVVLEHDIPVDLVLNLDQTLLPYVSPGKYTFCLKRSTTVPIKGADEKRQVTATFTVLATGTFLSIKLIYQGTTKRCLPNTNFRKSSTLRIQRTTGQISKNRRFI